MNSEELEMSLRTEFENYLKNVLAEMKQEISQLQEKVTTEIERHKNQLDEVFEVAFSNFEKERELDAGFKESVIEHLRLSRDEGAQITAMAIAKAEELEKEKAEELEKEKQLAAPSVGIKEIHQGVNEISSKTTQSEILKTLVHHATEFAPRGAFFIVKNEHLVGWRVFGKEKGSAEEKVREVFLPISANSVLSNAVKNLETVKTENGGHSDDAEVFEKLEFGSPDKMVSIPLVARGRGVAVLYADHGSEDGEVNAEALETLVRVAGLTVEVLASAKTVAKKPSIKKTEPVEESAQSEIAEPQEKVEYVAETVPAFVSQPVVEHSFESASFTAPAAVEEAKTGEEVKEPEEVKEFAETTDFVDDDSQIETTQPVSSDYEFETVSTVETEPQTAFKPSAEFESVPESAQVEFESTETDFQPGFEAPTEFESTETETDPTFVPSVDFETVSAPPQSEFESAEAESQTSFELVTDFKPATQVEFETTTSEPTAEFETTFETTSPQVEFEPTAQVEEEKYPDFEPSQAEEEKYPTFETSSWTSTTETTPGFSAQEFAQNFAKETDPAEYAKENFSYQPEAETVTSPVQEYEFETSGSYQEVKTESFTAPATEEFVPTKEQTYGSFEVENGKAETPVSQPVSTPPAKSRLSERNVDLPIEVTEDERRLHNDARRFARLLVSEIKLYNEQKVKEGRDSSDLYDRLKEAIDRSREMYDKRVQPPVAAKFDYFHYELVNTLAEGDDNKLGAGYPGAAV